MGDGEDRGWVDMEEGMAAEDMAGGGVGGAEKSRVTKWKIVRIFAG